MSNEVPDAPLPRDEAAESMDDAGVRRVQRAMLKQIALASTGQHLTVAAAAGAWQPFLAGIRCRVLFESEGALSYLLELQPGAVLPAHRHPQDEECVVLQGSLRIGDVLVLRQGDYHLGRRGILHAEITTDEGALIFLRGAPPEEAACI
jgi:quercetin dioxygenase-like cupin family protein